MQISIGTGRETRIRDIVIISVAFLIFGILLIFLNFKTINKTVDWIPLKAEIVDMIPVLSGRSTSYEVFVSYVYDGITHPYQLLDVYESSMQIGKIIDIKVNPSDPTQFIYANGGFFNTLFIIGGCLAAIGVIMPSIWIPIKIHKRKAQQIEPSEKPKNSLF